MRRRASHCIASLALVSSLVISLFSSAAEIKVLKGDERKGEPCEINGVSGLCTKNDECKEDNGGCLWNGVVRLCAQGPAGETIVCCRKPYEVAKELCNSWKHYWRSNEGKCIAKYPLVVGGEEAKPGQFPEIAHLGVIKNKRMIWICGATLLSPHFVLTAAHCVFKKAEYILRFGQHDLVKADLTNISRIVGSVPIGLFREEELHYETRLKVSVEQTVRVSHVIHYPDYKRPYHDIALLQLERPVVFTKRVLPACLPSNPKDDFKNYQPLTLAGWGSLQYNKRNPSLNLQRVQIPIIEQERCARYFYEKSSFLLPMGILAKQLCAGDVGKNSCKGDSGGPLVLQMRETQSSIPCEHTLAGVVSFGYGCGRLSIYSRVSSYVNWITGYIAPKLLPKPT